MATSIQRMIIGIIMIDLMFVLMGGFIYGNTNAQELEITTYQGDYQNWTKEFNDGYLTSNPQTDNSFLSQQVGDDKFAGRKVFNILQGGVNAPDLEIDPTDYSGSGGKWIYWLVGFFLIIINILGVFEIFQIFYSKKNT